MLNNVQTAILRDELRNSIYNGKTVDEAYHILHDTQITTTTTTRQKPPTITESLNVFSSETCAKLTVNPNLTDLRDKLLALDIAGITLWLTLFLKGGIVTQEEVVQLQTLLQRTESVETRTESPARFFTVFRDVPNMPNIIELEDFTTVFNDVRGG